MSEKQTCRECGLLKDKSEFYRSAIGRESGTVKRILVYARCKRCECAYQRERYWVRKVREVNPP